LIVPDLFWPEMGNILWKASRAGRISNKDALAALDYMQTLNIPTYASTDFMTETLRLAQLFERSFCDSLYVTLAVHSSMDLVTADERLANALAAHLPLKWLGAM
jgi:predicted nucleic acid-binding protein